MQQKWNQSFDGEPMMDIPQKFLNAGCDVYMVMQLRHDEKILDERFASMRELNRRGKTPDPEHYEVTYYADLPAMWQDVPNNDVLEELFQVFNLSRPHSKCTVRTLGSNVTIQMVGSVFVLYCEIPTR